MSCDKANHIVLLNTAQDYSAILFHQALAAAKLQGFLASWRSGLFYIRSRNFPPKISETSSSWGRNSLRLGSSQCRHAAPLQPCAARIRRQNPGFACLVCSAPDLFFFFSFFFPLIKKWEKKAICRFCEFFLLLLFSFFFSPHNLHTASLDAFSSTTTHQTCTFPPPCQPLIWMDQNKLNLSTNGVYSPDWGARCDSLDILAQSPGEYFLSSNYHQTRMAPPWSIFW